MPLYKCIVSNSQGKKIEVLREAATEDFLIASFSNSTDFLLNYDLVNNEKKQILKKRFSNKVVIEFTDIFSSLLDSQLPVQDALLMVKEISGSKDVKILAEELYLEILHGKNLYDAMSLFPTTFSLLYRGMVRLSEKTGNPSVVFKQLAEYLHKNEEIKTKLKNVMTYPCLVLSIVFFCCIGLITFVIPKMTEILLQFDNDSSLEIINKIEKLKIVFIFLFFLVLILIILFIFLSYLKKKNEQIAFVLDKILLNIPIIGKHIVSKQTLDFTFAMELLVGAGRIISESLQESALSVSNLYFRDAIYEVYKELEKGVSLSSAFAKTEIFHSYFLTWVKVGEKTGNVESVFSQIRRYYHSATERTIKKLLTWIEPGLILFSGLVIIFVVINFILPIFTMYGDIL